MEADITARDLLTDLTRTYERRVLERTPRYH